MNKTCSGKVLCLITEGKDNSLVSCTTVDDRVSLNIVGKNYDLVIRATSAALTILGFEIEWGIGNHPPGEHI